MVSPLSPDSHVCEYQSTGVQHPSTLEFGQIIRQSDQTNYQTCSMRVNSRPICLFVYLTKGEGKVVRRNLDSGECFRAHC